MNFKMKCNKQTSSQQMNSHLKLQPDQPPDITVSRLHDDFGITTPDNPQLEQNHVMHHEGPRNCRRYHYCYDCFSFLSHPHYCSHQHRPKTNQRHQWGQPMSLVRSLVASSCHETSFLDLIYRKRKKGHLVDSNINIARMVSIMLISACLLLYQSNLAHANLNNNNNNSNQAPSSYNSSQLNNIYSLRSSPASASSSSSSSSSSSTTSNSQRNGSPTTTLGELSWSNNKPQISGLSSVPVSGSNSPLQLRVYGQDKDILLVDLISPNTTTNLHEPRIELRFQQSVMGRHPFVTLDERSQNDTFVALVVTNDPDSGPAGQVNLAIENGNELGHFTLKKLTATSNTHTILVSGAPLSAYQNPEYNLTLVARDRGQPSKSSVAHLVIKLNASSSQSPQTMRGLHNNQHLGNNYPYNLNGNNYNNPNLNSNQNNNAMLDPMMGTNEPTANLLYVGTMLVLMFAAVILIIIFACALVRRPTVKKSPATGSGRTLNSCQPTVGQHGQRMHYSRAQDHCLCLGLTDL